MFSVSSVCLDTHIFIWGVLKTADLGREHLIPKAKKFLEYLSLNKIIAVVPSVVLAELLMSVPPEEYEVFISQFSQSYHIVPFGIIEAMYFGKIWHAKNSDETLKEIKEDLKALGIAAKSKIKFDMQIVATALARKCSKIISHDDYLKKIAEGFIKVEEIPDVYTQEKIF